MVASDKHVIVSLAEELYGIPVIDVETILPDQRVVRVPRTPKMLLGVFELRGATLAAMDLRLRLELPERPGAAQFVVVHTPAGLVALRVDSVAGIEPISESDIEAPNGLVRSDNDGFLSAVAKVGGKLVCLIDLEHIVPANLRRKVENPPGLMVA